MLHLMNRFHLQLHSALALIIVSVSVAGQVVTENSKCFELYTAGAEIGFRHSINTDWVSEAVVTDSVVARLRTAGLEIGPEGSDNEIVVHVNNTDVMIILELELYKLVTDPVTGLSKSSRTWADRVFGRVSSGDQASISSGLAQLANTFLGEYMSAQEECSRPSDNRP